MNYDFSIIISVLRNLQVNSVGLQFFFEYQVKQERYQVRQGKYRAKKGEKFESLNTVVKFLFLKTIKGLIY